MSVLIYQIQYDDDVVGGYDPSFMKFDCRDNPEFEKREIAHIQRFYETSFEGGGPEGYVGLVSPKFNDKAKITGDDFISWVKDNPGYDVYFINPFPHLKYLHFNVWEQGEFWHPGLISCADELFKGAGVNIKPSDFLRNSSDSLLYSNYWIANKEFWDSFMLFVARFTKAVDMLGEKAKKKIFSEAPHYASATFYPFVFERIFSTFLAVNKDFKCLAYPYSHSEIIARCTNDFERDIVNNWSSIIDDWDRACRQDPEVKKIFSNLEGMQRKFLNPKY